MYLSGLALVSKSQRVAILNLSGGLSEAMVEAADSNDFKVIPGTIPVDLFRLNMGEVKLE